MFTSHSGMSWPPIECDTYHEARRVAARYLRSWRNREYTVTTLVSGKRWEITEPEDAFMVPDDAGFLSIIDTQEGEHGSE